MEEWQLKKPDNWHIPRNGLLSVQLCKLQLQTMTFAVISCKSSAQPDIYLRLVGQEGDVDLRQSLGDFGSAAFYQLIEERIGAG